VGKHYRKNGKLEEKKSASAPFVFVSRARTIRLVRNERARVKLESGGVFGWPNKLAYLLAYKPRYNIFLSKTTSHTNQHQRLSTGRTLPGHRAHCPTWAGPTHYRAPWRIRWAAVHTSLADARRHALTSTQTATSR